jgi:hypothetical protein
MKKKMVTAQVFLVIEWLKETFELVWIPLASPDLLGLQF